MGIQKYENLIQDHALSASALGAPGAFFPGLDIAGVAAIWGRLLFKIAKESGKEFDESFTLKFATKVAGGVAAYLAGSRVFAMMLNLIPGIGTLAYVGINCGLNYIFTIRYGQAVARLFEQDSFSASNLADAAVIITAICGLPSLSEIKDAFSMIS